MNYDFLRGYTIPTNHSVDGGGRGPPPASEPPSSWAEVQKIDSHCGFNNGYNQAASLQQPPPPPSALMGFCDGYGDMGGGEYDQRAAGYPQYPNRFIPPGKQGGKFRAPPSRPFKRKYPGTGTGASKPEVIAETTPDGQLVIFQGRDESYPDELNKLIHPLSCELCATMMNSLHSAKDHYESKAHDRNITLWLTKNYTDQGLNPPSVKRFAKAGPTGPDAFHCELCDLKLTSVTHASQHYSGRKHKLVAASASKPSGAGYYNNEGKWVRTGTKFTATDTDGRFGIGEQFKREQVAAAAADTTTSAEGETKETVAVATPAIAAVAVAAPIDNSLHCSVCNVSVTSVVQMTTHLEGAKHRKKLKQSGVEVPPTPTPIVCSVAAVAEKTESGADISILASVTQQSVEPSVDLSMYRTPTGSYYCKTCNMSMCHVSALQQHLLGKKHIKKSVEEKAAKTTAGVPK